MPEEDGLPTEDGVVAVAADAVVVGVEEEELEAVAGGTVEEAEVMEACRVREGGEAAAEAMEEASMRGGGAVTPAAVGGAVPDESKEEDEEEEEVKEEAEEES